MATAAWLMGSVAALATSPTRKMATEAIPTHKIVTEAVAIPTRKMSKRRFRHRGTPLLGIHTCSVWI